jgi:hypothetical protein
MSLNVVIKYEVQLKELIVQKVKILNFYRRANFVVFVARHPPGGQVHLIYELSRSQTTTHHSR